MVRTIGSFLLVIFCTTSLPAQKPMFPFPLSPRIANYSIDVRLDTRQKKLYGHETLVWKNTSPDYISNLQFHLYLNAFKNNQSTYLQGEGDRTSSNFLDEVDGWGWINVTKINFEDSIPLSDSCAFIQPDDQNSFDQTVLRVNLPQSIPPGHQITLQIDFEAKLPRVVARTGYEGDFYMVGQWFPKIGVYEPAGMRQAIQGRWNCHQFHATSEFYADYGNYEVTITLPSEYLVAACGVKIAETDGDDGTKSVTYYCEDVHDFAWSADTDYQIVEDQWQNVKLYFYSQPLHSGQAGRHLQAAKNTLQYCAEWIGPYPYPTLTIVDPQYRAFEAGGMEYPTLFTAGTFWLMPSGIKFPEEVVVHETIHNYFYGLIGSNEFEEAWLDEGLTTYMEFKIMSQYYGQGGGTLLSLFDLNIDEQQMDWGAYRSNARRDIIVKNAWQYDRGGYGILSYYKPALMLLTLENYLGQDVMKEILHRYYDHFRFKHPGTADFVATVNQVSGQNLDWFFDQVLFGSDVLDYKVDKITVHRKSKPHGIFATQVESATDTVKHGVETDTGRTAGNKDSAEIYISKVIVAREGEVVFPEEILVKFDDGEEVLEKWDGCDRYIVYRYEKPAKVISAEVDPGRKVWLDCNFLNNGKTVGINRMARYKYSLRWLFWMQNLLQSVSIF
jgi:hypothetical protein